MYLNTCCSKHSRTTTKKPLSLISFISFPVSRYFKTFVLSLVLLGSGCVAVEFDRMTGTQFPTDQFRNGQTHSISSIYLDAGFLLTVEEDESNITPLNISDSDCISDAELDSLQNGHRSAPLFPTGNTYHLWGIVVNHHGEALDTCSPGWVTGKMWSQHTRSAFALFYPHPTIQGDGQAYLRTTVHEIGHALNLHHEDGTGSTTIMNQTGNINENWVYEFSVDSMDHLQNHPPKCKFPGAVGGAPFLWVNADHHALHPDVTTAFDCGT